MTPHELGFTDQEIVDAMVRANADRGKLARLRRQGRVRRADNAYEMKHPEVARPFARDIEERARPDINTAIRPKKRKKR